MKKLLLGLTLLVSISSFATERIKHSTCKVDKIVDIVDGLDTILDEDEIRATLKKKGYTVPENLVINDPNSLEPDSKGLVVAMRVRTAANSIMQLSRQDAGLIERLRVGAINARTKKHVKQICIKTGSDLNSNFFDLDENCGYESNKYSTKGLATSDAYEKAAKSNLKMIPRCVKKRK